MQSRARTILKGVSWQAIGLVTTTVTAFLLTGSVATGGMMAISSAILGMILFVLHERAWDCVRWGRAAE